MPEPRVIDHYTLRRRILSGNPERGLPDLWQAHDAGDIYYIKIWRLRGQNGPDIRALWNREVRGLMRLQGYPGASELFVRLHDLRANEDRYYAVLDGGTRILLSAALQERGRYNWLLNLGEIGRRVPLWEGLLRIAEAVSILHSEGTLHRSLSSTAVFTNPDGQGDFRLSGFEWSLRIPGSEGASAKVGQRYAVNAPELDREGEYSTASDWFDFGLLAAELFGVPVRSTKNATRFVQP